MELDVVHLARLVDEGVGVHAKALHVPVVLGHSNVVQQEGELHTPQPRSGLSPEHMMPGACSVSSSTSKSSLIRQAMHTMCMASGWWEKKSMMRQPSWMWFLGLGFSACTMSGNFMPAQFTASAHMDLQVQV